LKIEILCTIPGVRFTAPDNLGIGVDCLESARKFFDLYATDRFGSGLKLPIDVCGANTIRVYYRQMPDPRANKGFGAPGADTPNAEENYPGLRQTLHCVVAHEDCQTGKGGIHIHEISPEPFCIVRHEQKYLTPGSAADSLRSERGYCTISTAKPGSIKKKRRTVSHFLRVLNEHVHLPDGLMLPGNE
jgi:hypothetical protein